MSIAKKVGQASFLIFIRKIWGALITFTVLAYLARTLDKSDFGILALSQVFIGFIQLLALSGISEYVIFYNGKDEKKVINSAFWLNLLLTSLVCVLIFIIAPFVSTYYNDERITSIIYLLLIGFFFKMLSAISVGQFRKQINYKPLIYIQTLFNTLIQLSQAFFAYKGFGVYSLAIPNAIFLPLMSISLIYFCDFRPVYNFGIKYWKQIIDYTKYIIGVRILNKFVNEGDTIIIGKVFNLEVLGIYNIAFQFSHLIFQQISPIVNNISLPLYAKMKADMLELRKLVLRVLKLMSFIIVPIICFQYIFSEFLILTIYGNNWVEAIIPFQLLSIFVLCKALGSPLSGLYNATGKPEYGLYLSMIITPIFIISILYSSSYNSLIVTTIFIVVVRSIGSLSHFLISSRILNYSSYKLFFNSSKSFLPAVISSFCLFCFLDSYNLYRNIFFIVLFYILYFLLYRLIFKDDLNEIKLDLIKIMPKKILNFFSKI